MFRSRHSLRYLSPLLALSLSACVPQTSTLVGPAPSVSPSVSPSASPSLSPSPASATSADPSPATSPASPAPLASPAPVSDPSPGPSPEPSAAASASPVTAPSPPLNLSVVERSGSSLTLQWDFPADARSFNLFLDGEQVAGGHVTPNYYAFTGLALGRSYRLGVQSVNAGGESEIVSLSAATISGRSASGNFSGGGSSGGSKRSLAAPVGGEILRANAATDYGQYEPAIAMDADGDYVVVWEDLRNNDSYDIYAQRFHADGSRDGDEILVNTYVTGNQEDPSVAMDRDGNFVVAWSGPLSDSSGDGAFARVFPAAGSPDDEFRLDSSAAVANATVQVGLSEAGRLTAVWQAGNFPSRILARQFDLGGNPEHDEQSVSADGALFPINPRLAVNRDGDFVVVWEAFAEAGAQRDIFARRFDAAAEPRGQAFNITDESSIVHGLPDVAINASGRFLVVWEEDGSDGSNTGAFGQRFGSDGEARGEAFQINTITEGGQFTPAVAMDDQGDFIVVWEDYIPLQTFSEVYIRRYDSAGRALGEEFRVRELTEQVSYHPDVAMDADGEYAVTWAEETAIDDYHADIYTRAFRRD